MGAEFNGTVELNTLDVDPTSGLVKLPTNFSDRSQQIASGCSVTQKNRFVVSNRGGLPTNPTDTLRGEIVWYDVRDLSNEVANSTAGSNYQTVNNQEPIVEAQGLIVGADGTMQLLASIPQVTPLTPWQVSPSCDVKP